jgi:lipopolysaccharide/colanic/teichoic acid biosynthesis glycosyltransferase
MSIVGPRADRPEILQSVVDDFPLIFERTRGIKPGITGLAQLELKSNGELMHGLDDELYSLVCPDDNTKSVLSFRYKLYYEAAYQIMLTDFWTFLKTDISIMIRTPLVMFLRYNTI